MGRKRFTEQAYLFSLRSFQDERCNLIKDSLGQSTDLYEALYENKNTPLRSIEFDRYELLALKRHWENTVKQIGKMKESDYYASLKLFVKVYRRYVANIRGTAVDMNLLDANLEGLEQLIVTNRNWEENLKKCRITFLKAEKELEDKIESLREAGN